MKKPRNIAAATLATLALMVGGLVTAAPAHALWGTEVYVQHAAYDSWARSTNMEGTDKILHEGMTANNARYICPPSTGWFMVVYGPAGVARELAAGECYTFTKATSSGNPYKVSVLAERDRV